MKAFLAKIKAFIDLLPVPFVRLAIVLLLVWIGWTILVIPVGEFSLMTYILAFLAGAYLWDGLKIKLMALKGWLGW